MPFIPVADTAMVELRMDLLGELTENTLYFERDSAIDAAALTGLASNLRDWWDGVYSNFVHAGCALREVTATDLTSETAGQVSVAGGGLVGTRGGFPLANNVAICVSFRTALRGRSFRGRNFISGLTDDVMASANTIDEDLDSDLVGGYGALLSAAVPSDWTWVVVSRFSGGDPRPAGVTTPVTTVVVTDRTVDSMRRRLPGRGA